MDGISVSWRLFPEEMMARHALQRRKVVRSDGAEPEFQFLYREPAPQLPVWVGNELRIASWGPLPASRLPRHRAIARESMLAENWQELSPKRVQIPAQLGFDKGVWFVIREGVEGVLVRDERSRMVVYLLTEPASHYYQVMTRNPRMPVMCGERI